MNVNVTWKPLAAFALTLALASCAPTATQSTTSSAPAAQPAATPAPAAEQPVAQPAPAQPAATAPATGFAGFSLLNVAMRWEVPGWSEIAGTITQVPSLTERPATANYPGKMQGNFYKLAFNSNSKPDAKVVMSTMKDAGWNFSNVGVFNVKVYNPTNQDMKIGVAISTGNWQWHESVQYDLKANSWTDLQVDLNASNFKTEASGWKNEVALANRGSAKQLNLLIFPQGKLDSYVLIGDVQTDKEVQ